MKDQWTLRTRTKRTLLSVIILIIFLGLFGVIYSQSESIINGLTQSGTTTINQQAYYQYNVTCKEKDHLNGTLLTPDSIDFVIMNESSFQEFIASGEIASAYRVNSTRSLAWGIEISSDCNLHMVYINNHDYEVMLKFNTRLYPFIELSFPLIALSILFLSTGIILIIVFRGWMKGQKETSTFLEEPKSIFRRCPTCGARYVIETSPDCPSCAITMESKGERIDSEQIQPFYAPTQMLKGIKKRKIPIIAAFNIILVLIVSVPISNLYLDMRTTYSFEYIDTGMPPGDVHELYLNIRNLVNTTVNMTHVEDANLIYRITMKMREMYTVNISFYIVIKNQLVTSTVSIDGGAQFNLPTIREVRASEIVILIGNKTNVSPSSIISGENVTIFS